MAISTIDFTSWPWWIRLLLDDPERFQVFATLVQCFAIIVLGWFVFKFIEIFFHK